MLMDCHVTDGLGIPKAVAVVEHTLEGLSKYPTRQACRGEGVSLVDWMQRSLGPRVRKGAGALARSVIWRVHGRGRCGVRQNIRAPSTTRPRVAGSGTVSTRQASANDSDWAPKER